MQILSRKYHRTETAIVNVGVHSDILRENCYNIAFPRSKAAFDN